MGGELRLDDKGLSSHAIPFSTAFASRSLVLCSTPAMTHFATGLKHWARTALTSVVGLFLPAKPSQRVRTAEPVTEDEQLTTTRNRKDSSPKPAEVPALDVVAPINPAADTIDVSRLLRLSDCCC
jgi:hypothetical protein